MKKNILSQHLARFFQEGWDYLTCLMKKFETTPQYEGNDNKEKGWNKLNWSCWKGEMMSPQYEFSLAVSKNWEK